jgi:hypothetical protein
VQFKSIIFHGPPQIIIDSFTNKLFRAIKTPVELAIADGEGQTGSAALDKMVMVDNKEENDAFFYNR